MKIWCSIIFLLLAFLTVAKAIFFKFEDCSKENGASETVRLNIRPDPIELDQYIYVNMSGRLIKDIPPEAVLKVQHYKLRKLFGMAIHIPISCVLGKYGSCTLPLCEYLLMFKEQVKPFFPPGRTYGCPVKAGDYGAQNVKIQNPDVSAMTRAFISGKYQTEMNLLDSRNGTELACYKVFTELK